MPVAVTSHRTTRVLCGTDGVAALMSVGGTSVDGEIVLIRRTSIDPVTGLDRLQLLTGNGGPVTDTSFQGPVLSRLCGRTGCGCSSPGRPGPQPPRLRPWPYT